MTYIRSRLLIATTLASVSFATLMHAQGAGAPPRPRDAQGPPGMMRRNAPPGAPDGAPGAAVGPRYGNRNGPGDGRRFGPSFGPGSGQRGASRGHPAAMMLRMRSELQLTDDQVKKLESLQDAAAPRVNEADMLRARADLMEASQGDGNLSKARAALDRLSALRNERVVAGLKQRQDARAVLTAAQKTRLDNMRGQFAGRARMNGGPRGAR